jgi:hypothetical protein
MSATETEQAGLQTAVRRDCTERVPSSTRERLDSWKVIACYLARSGACDARIISSAAAIFALFYFQQVNGERCSGALQRQKFRNSLIS